MNTKNKQTTAAALIIVVFLILVGIFAYFEYFEQEEVIEETEPLKEIDDRISPYTNQGITIEILRMRHRGLTDLLLKFGTKWKNEPTFYWITDVDGKLCDTSQIEASAGMGGSGTFTDWDTITKESRVNYYTKEEQVKSEIKIILVEQVKSGFLGRKTRDIEREEIRLSYDYRTGRWTGDDSFKDYDGVGHYLGETFELWFNIYQSDYDHDGIPYWTEVNVLGTNPTIDDSALDPDNDGIPSSWEWKWDYDPLVWDDHRNLDPDIDGIENIEEYQMRKWFSNPYQPDVYVETDGM